MPKPNERFHYDDLLDEKPSTLLFGDGNMGYRHLARLALCIAILLATCTQPFWALMLRDFRFVWGDFSFGAFFLLAFSGLQLLTNLLTIVYGVRALLARENHAWLTVLTLAGAAGLLIMWVWIFTPR